MSSNTTPPPSMPPSENESLVQHVLRSAKNTFTKCFGSARTGNDKVKIAKLQFSIESRKKAFGVAYMNLKLATAADETPDEAALQSLVDNALADIGKLQKEIDGFQASILKKQDSTQRKIVPKPAASGGAAPAVAPAETVVAAPAVTTTPSPALASVQAPPANIPAPTTTETTAPATTETMETVPLATTETAPPATTEAATQ